ncbi:hypothetical protein EJ05DRAFT_243735 [Pseudovirgaria hyperparasitica]|uniref:Mediator of RNA polymerase II transcription subunit 11 n=1 Tax=Pseudovirgaria hyperparasitica TaxID=470096 RepID=A0A6A6WDD4_9PEZI|nr:uncharacterized protein EJ05DRAFT_243735 [Pseudovirgaria hyperparasitica]KAF2760838.1 hypothetical protein EJ05DRAFT_243735 [Pseudovirgaria hyperparasitica]
MEGSPPKELRDASNAAKHIRELNVIDQKIPEILKYARAAMVALSPSPTNNPTLAENDPDPTDEHKRAFLKAARRYFSLVLDVQDALAAQTKALEDAGIIASKAEDQGDGRHMSLGQLDVGWLNERRGDVGRGFEGELMAQARAVVEKLLKERGSTEHTMTGV